MAQASTTTPPKPLVEPLPSKDTTAKIARLCTTNAFAKLLWPHGPYDGGCLRVALALQRLFPGAELYALWSNRPGWPQPEHALLKCGDDFFLDASGGSSAAEISTFFAREVSQGWLAPATLSECLDADCGGYRDYGGDQAVKKLATFFEHGLDARLLDQP